MLPFCSPKITRKAMHAPNRKLPLRLICAALGMTLSGPVCAQIMLAQSPLFLTQGQAPLVLLTMARDHKLFYEAYNDYSDLDGDGSLDVGYKPDAIDYYGYFDSYKCYTYSDNRFAPSSKTLSTVVDGKTVQTKKCSGKWSGDFLNYVTMSRMDALRKVLYGGYRSTDTAELTILERSFIPQDAHSWGKEYQSLTRDGYDIREYTPLSLPATGRFHVFANTTLTSAGSPPLMRALTNTSYRVWEWLSIERPVAGNQCAIGNNVRDSCTKASGSSMTDYTVRIEVCNQSAGTEANCKTYGTSNKPVGLLQRQGENGGMYFGLLSGSYANNTQGGVLRKAISSINNEITADGRFGGTDEDCAAGTKCVNGIISTINKLRITGFNYANHEYGCGWITTRQMINGECNAWGNPVGEMLYEGLRYFSGKTDPTASFMYSSGTDVNLGLPKLGSWTNPYVANSPNTSGTPATFASCAKPYAMLISDVYPSFDSDTVPGSAFATYDGDITGMNVNTLGKTIWNGELGANPKNVFIGQVGNSEDGTPSAKPAQSLGNIRGLAPGEPTREGSFSSASAAYYGHINDLNNVAGNQKLNTYSVALASPLPKLEIPVDGKTVTILPLAKSVAGSSISADAGKFQPTNQIVDFYVDTIRNVAGSPTDDAVNSGRPYYKFRINYEDVEQGADHDMDAVALYEIKLNADDTVSVRISSDYAAGGITQHMGFAISGTTNDGAYLVVRDSDTSQAADKDISYALDCELSSGDTNPANCPSAPPASTALPLVKELKFTASTAGSATLLKDPLWYAAKWGGFVDDNSNNLPDSTEWDADSDGVPDNYFMVTNPLSLETQLTKAFAKIKNESATAAATATNSFSYQNDSTLYQARFSSDGWGGELNAYPISLNGDLGDPSWQAHYELADITASNRKIFTYDPDVGDASARGIPFKWASMTGSKGYLRSSLNKNYSGTADSLGADRVSYLRGETIADMRTRPFIKGTNIVNKLGDIISSQPQYVAIPNSGHGETTYADFREDFKDRAPMLYLGANDGMLHGFSTADGAEKLAYIPSEMYRTRNEQPGLSKLTASNYGQSANAHRYYVDGSPTAADVCKATCDDKSDWKTILVGGLNAGGQGIYALNITDPSNFTEANAASLVMWEFNDWQDSDDDADMQYGLGYTFSRPAVARVCTKRTAGVCEAGRWVVIFGNGYNNTEADGYASGSGHAILYVLDALTGSVIKKINTKAGSTAKSNGLSSPAAVDVDNDDYADYVYAGDLLGNMWKFDLTDVNSSKWKVAYGTPTKPAPLYIAKFDGKTQQITSAPDAMRHPDGGIQVVFGTGSYLSITDKQDTSQNTLYGIRDAGDEVDSTDLGNLQQQTINTNSAMVGSAEYRTVSTNTVSPDKDGWYLHLPDTGERIVNDPRIFSSALGVTSTVPNDDICGYGGWSWNYFIDPLTGGRLSWSIFADIGSLTYGDGDGAASGVASAKKSGVGMSGNDAIINAKGGNADTRKCGSTGECEHDPLKLRTGRLSWREIIRN